MGVPSRSGGGAARPVTRRLQTPLRIGPLGPIALLAPRAQAAAKTARVHPFCSPTFCLLLLTLIGLGFSGQADASPIDALDPEREWLVAGIEVEGNRGLATADIRRVIETRTRSRFVFWRKRPVFDQTVFERDRERIVRLYETEGYYQAKAGWRIDVRHTTHAEILVLIVLIEEGPRTFVTSIEIDPPDPTLAPSATEAAKPRPDGKAEKRRWALEVGDPFREADYHRLEGQLRAAYLDRGFASVTTERSARISLDRSGVAIRYEITPGEPARFGSISIDGLEKVDRHLVQRELTFSTGDAFSLSRIEESRRRIQALDLFGAIDVDWKTDPEHPDTASVSIAVHEKKTRELRIGGGYSTEARARAHVRWQNRNFLGGGRRLLLSGSYSYLLRSADIAFAQPHLFDRNNRGLFEFSLFQQYERSFKRDSIQGVPAFERRFTPSFTGTVGFRVDAAAIHNVSNEVRDGIGGVRDEGMVIGPRIALRWTPIDDIARPRKGMIASFEAQYSTRAIGATYDYLRMTGEVAMFHPVFDWAVMAGRMKLGAAQAFGSPERLPIFERFYAGGEGSVRGYRRRQLGPTTKNGDPLGGRSLIEGSIEARIPVWRAIGVVGFLDFGQVSLNRYDFVPNHLRFSAGPGVSYSTPIGPISLFAGFPINLQPGEAPWQIHFNIGFFF